MPAVFKDPAGDPRPPRPAQEVADWAHPLAEAAVAKGSHCMNALDVALAEQTAEEGGTCDCGFCKDADSIGWSLRSHVSLLSDEIVSNDARSAEHDDELPPPIDELEVAQAALLAGCHFFSTPLRCG